MAIDKRATRLGVLALVGVMLFSLLGVRLWFLQTVRPRSSSRSPRQPRPAPSDLAPERGRIFDADGRILADNQRVLTVAVDWQQIRRKTDRQEIFRRLSAWVDVPVEDMEARFQSNVVQPVPPDADQARIDEPTAIALEERIEDFPGCRSSGVETGVPVRAARRARDRVHGRDHRRAARRLPRSGYLRNERVGQFGIELSMERALHGEWGEQVFEVDAANRPVRLIRDIPPINGFDVQLTIDLELQQYAEQAIETTLKARRTQNAPNPRGQEARRPHREDGPVARRGAVQGAGRVGVVMDYTDGTVLALASYPTFDNRWFEAGLSSRKFSEIFPSENPDGTPIDPDRSILVNRAVQGRYNLGSTFKPIVAFAALDSGLITPGFYYRDEGTYRSSRRRPGRPLQLGAGPLRVPQRHVRAPVGRASTATVNVEDALAVSSDTFFYRIGEKIMSENNFEPVLQEEVPQVRLRRRHRHRVAVRVRRHRARPALKAKLRRARRDQRGRGPGYFVGDNVQLAIGQGLLSATPLQLTTAYATIANQGFVYQPKLVKAIYNPGVPDGRARLRRPRGGHDLREPRQAGAASARSRCRARSARRSSPGCAA
jgi:penicillin-binding protein 2